MAPGSAKTSRQAHILVHLVPYLCQLPAVVCAYAADEQIALFTANGESLRPSFNKMLTMAHVADPERQARFHVLGCENVDGFDAVAKGVQSLLRGDRRGAVARAAQALAANQSGCLEVDTFAYFDPKAPLAERERAPPAPPPGAPPAACLLYTSPSPRDRG